MIYICPNCGHQLPTPIEDGICICPTCQYDVYNNLYDRLMSAAWTIIRKNVKSFDQLKKMMKYPENETILVAAYMIDNCFSIDEFKIALMNLNIKKQY